MSKSYNTTDILTLRVLPARSASDCTYIVITKASEISKEIGWIAKNMKYHIE